MQHSFGGGSDGVEDTEWEDCGVLKTRVTEKESSVVFNGIKVAYDSLSDKTKELMGLAAKSGGYYRLRIATTSSGASARDQDFVVTSVKAACLGASNFRYRDHLNLHRALLSEVRVADSVHPLLSPFFGAGTTSTFTLMNPHRF